VAEEGSANAFAVDSVTHVRGPFRITEQYNFSSDSHTRIMLVTSDLGLTQPNGSILSVQANDSNLISHPLTVENVGPLTGVAGLNGSYIIVRLPDGLPAGNLQLTITLRGLTSNAGIISISP
jgi:hypothetical protein